jgi:hypothetical protein
MINKLIRGGGISKLCRDADKRIELLIEEHQLNYNYKYDIAKECLVIIQYLFRGSVTLTEKVCISAFYIFRLFATISSSILKDAFVPTCIPVLVFLCAIVFVVGVILLFVFLFLWAWYGDTTKASNEFKKLFGDNNKDKQNEPLSSNSYISKFNLKNIMTNIFIFFGVDNILTDDELSCRQESIGNCDDIKHISGEYIDKSKNKCYNLKKPRNIEWKLKNYIPHHYNKLNIYGDNMYGYTQDILDNDYPKNKINIKWVDPPIDDAKYYKLDCANFNVVGSTTEFKSGLICDHK